jgi:hypothetical protein
MIHAEFMVVVFGTRKITDKRWSGVITGSAGVSPRPKDSILAYP